jgi:TonB-linked SusC/RagA family outer membrane protein
MHFKAHRNPALAERRLHTKIIQVMKLTFILMLAACLQVSAKGYSQNITLSLKNAPLEKMFGEVKRQTGYSFIYTRELLQNATTVTLEVINAPLEKVLENCFKGQPLTYTIEKKFIIVKPRPSPVPMPAIADSSLEIHGLITDNNGLPLQGATILLKGTDLFAVSEKNGSFRISVGRNITSATLVVSMIGYGTMEKEIKNPSGALVIKLQQVQRQLDSVVVTALGITRLQRSLGYAYSEVKGEDMTKVRGNNAVEALSGRVAGLEVTTTNSGVGASTKVTLRGVKTIGGDSQPLYVIDGIPIDNTTPGQADTYGGYDLGDGSSIINPDEIETISVLKGGAAAALYGSRAANGVILITTKKGSKKGTVVDYTSNAVFARIQNSYDYQEQYGAGSNNLLPRDVATAMGYAQSSWGPKFNADSMSYIFNGTKQPYVNAHNSISHFFRTGLTLTNSIGVSTGDERNQLRFTYTNLYNKDVVPQSGLKRNNVSIRGTSQLSNRFSIDAKIAYLNEKVDNRPALSDNPNNIGYVLSGVAPNIDMNWLKAYKDPVTGEYVNWNNNPYQVNPYWAINEQPNTSTKDQLNGFVTLKFKILPTLSIQARSGTDYAGFHFREFMNYSTPFNETGQLVLIDRTIRETNTELLLNFGKQVRKFWIGANAGANRMDYRGNIVNTTGRDISIPGVQSINNFQTVLSNEVINRKRINSVYGALNLAYENYLYLDLTARNDWSSTLAQGNNSFFYPSVSSSFIFSELIPKNRTLSYGKLRASFAQTGTDAISPYELKLTYGPDISMPTIGGYAIGGVAVNEVPFMRLKPSISNAFEVGTNLAFFDSRVNLDLTWYKTNTKNQILQAPISTTSGYSTAIINSGNIENKGIEITLGLKPVVSRTFNWEVNLNFARNRNKIIRLSPLVSSFYTLASARWANASIVAKEGDRYGIIVGHDFLKDSSTGKLILDANNLPQYDPTDKKLGNSLYDWTGGINNKFSYKNISFSFLLDFKQGGNIYSMTNLLAYSTGRQKGTLAGREGWVRSEQARVAAGVTQANWVATDGLPVSGVNANGDKVNAFVNPQTYWQRVASNIPAAFIYDASYVKVRQINLDYSMPAATLRNTPLKECTISLVARNPFILSKHVPNIDPESSYNNSNGQGFEYGSLPTRRSYGINLYLKF